MFHSLHIVLYIQQYITDLYISFVSFKIVCTPSMIFILVVSHQQCYKLRIKCHIYTHSWIECIHSQTKSINLISQNNANILLSSSQLCHSVMNVIVIDENWLLSVQSCTQETNIYNLEPAQKIHLLTKFNICDYTNIYNLSYMTSYYIPYEYYIRFFIESRVTHSMISIIRNFE